LRSPRYPIEKFVGRRDWTAVPRSIPRAQLPPRRRADGTPPRLPVFVSLERRRVRAFAARDAFRGTHLRLIVTCETARTHLRTRVAHSRVSLLGWLRGRRDARLTSGRRENVSRCSTTLRQRRDGNSPFAFVFVIPHLARFSCSVDDALIAVLLSGNCKALRFVFSIRCHEVRDQHPFCFPSEALNLDFQISRFRESPILVTKSQEIDRKQPACIAVRVHSRGR